jgi:DHA1 family bicyclomycin/chloramphenicol resistance-like MFS transporter
VTGAETAGASPPLSDRLLIALLAAITAAGPVAMNIYLPALPAVQAQFGTTVAEMNTTVSAALVAFAAGILLYGPVSDRFGRRPVILLGMAVFAAGNLLCLLAPTLEALLAGRVVQALGTSAGTVVARAMLGDLYPREKLARMLALLTMVMVLGPTTAPLVGGVITEALGWKAVFVFLLLANAAILLAAWRFLPETRQRADRAVPVARLVGAWASMLRKGAFLGFSIQAGTIFAVFLTFISLAPYVMAALGHSATEYGLWYLLVAIGYFVGNGYVARHAARVGLQKLITVGTTLQLVCALAGAGLVLAGFWHPAAVFVPMGLVGFAQGLCLPNIMASAVALAPRTAGAASSIIGFTQQLFGALAVQAMAVFPTDTPVPVYLFTVAATAAAWLSLFILPRADASAES